MKKNNADFLAVLCYIALIVAAVIVLFCNLLPHCGVKLESNFWNRLFSLLYTIRDISVLIAISMGSYVIAQKGKAWLIIYIIAIIVFAAAIVLYWF